MRRLLTPFQRFHRQGIRRLAASWLPVLQGALAAAVSWWIAIHWFGHHNVFFAPMAAIIVIGLTGGDRLRRAVELNIGVTLGVGIGDLLVTWLGDGVWQMGIMVAIALAVAVYTDKSQLVFTQLGIGVVLIATIFPPGTSGGVDRMLDSLIGGTTAIMILAVLPDAPLKGGRDEIAVIFRTASHVLREVAEHINQADPQAIHAALLTARGSQGNINALIAKTRAGKESARISPLHWGNRRRVKSLMRILNPVDNVMRNTRVLARRARILAEDQDVVSPQQLAAIETLAKVTNQLAVVYDRRSKRDETHEIPAITKTLRELGATLTPDIAAEHVLSAQMILGQTRSLVVDLLQICGLSRNSAKAVLAPTSEHPHQPPELYTKA